MRLSRKNSAQFAERRRLRDAIPNGGKSIFRLLSGYYFPVKMAKSILLGNYSTIIRLLFAILFLQNLNKKKATANRIGRYGSLD
jgi:hypothetical protein